MNGKEIKWFRLTPREALAKLGSSETEGLSQKEAYNRLRRNGPNRFMEPSKKLYGILGTLFRDPVLILTLLCGVLSLCFGEVLHGLPFLLLFAVWMGAFVIRLLVQINRFQTDFAFFRTPSVTVLRGGEAYLIPATHVVRGDVILLHEGDLVPCDCRLISAETVTVRLIFREGDKPTPHLYQKRADARYGFGDGTVAPDFDNMVYGGSEIVRGSASALAVELGDRSFLGAMGERFAGKGKQTVGEMPRGILPYCRLFSFCSLLLLFLVGIVSLFVAPASYSSLRVFLPVCVITASASVGVTGVYFEALLFRNRRAACAEKLKSNRVLIKTDAGNGNLPYLTDLFVIGRAAFSDGRQHLLDAYTPDGQAEGGPALTSLAEAFVLLAKAREILPAASCDRFTDPEDMTFLGELLKSTRFDLQALDVRLRSVSLLATGEEELLQVSTATGNFRLHFSDGARAVDSCSGFFREGEVLALTPLQRNGILAYCGKQESFGRRVVTVTREQNGAMLLIGLLSLGEAFLPDIPAQLARLRSAGVRITLISDLPEEQTRRYFRNCCPDIPVADATTFPEEEADGSLCIRTGVDQQALAEHLRDLRRAGRTPALLCGRADNPKLLAAAAVRICCDDCLSYPTGGEAFPEMLPLRQLHTSGGCTQTVRNAADILLCRASPEGGGIAALEPAIRRSRLTTHRLRALLWNLTLLKTVRTVFFTLCALSGLGPPTAAETCFACFGGDTLALAAAIRGKVQKPDGEPFRPDDGRMRSLFRNRRLWQAILIPPAASWLAVLLLRATGLAEADVCQSVPILGLLIFQTVLLTFAESDDVRMRTSAGYGKLAAAVLVPILPVILLSVLIPTVGEVTGLGSWSAVSVLFPVLCLLAGLGGTLAFTRGKSGK